MFQPLRQIDCDSTAQEWRRQSSRQQVSLIGSYKHGVTSPGKVLKSVIKRVKAANLLRLALMESDGAEAESGRQGLDRPPVHHRTHSPSLTVSKRLKHAYFWAVDKDIKQHPVFVSQNPTCIWIGGLRGSESSEAWQTHSSCTCELTPWLGDEAMLVGAWNQKSLWSAKNFLHLSEAWQEVKILLLDFCYTLLKSPVQDTAGQHCEESQLSYITKSFKLFCSCAVLFRIPLHLFYLCLCLILFCLPALQTKHIKIHLCYSHFSRCCVSVSLHKVPLSIFLPRSTK